MRATGFYSGIHTVGHFGKTFLRWFDQEPITLSQRLPYLSIKYNMLEMTEAFTAGVMIFIEQFRGRWMFAEANTPTATTPEDVSHSRGRNVEGRNPANGRRRDFVRRRRHRQSGFQHHGHLARNCSIKIITCL